MTIHIIIIIIFFITHPLTMGAVCSTIDYSTMTVCKESLSHSGLAGTNAKALLESPFTGVNEDASAALYISRLTSLLETNLDCDCCTDEVVPHSWICDDCIETYTYWVCSALFPPCEDDERLTAEKLCEYTLQRCPAIVEFKCSGIGTH